MRALLAVLLLAPVMALAEPTPQAIEVPVPTEGSNPLDADRLFNDVEVFRLDPGTSRIEGRFASGVPDTDPTLELHAEIGLTRHLQVGLGQDASAAPGHQPILSAVPVRLRYSLGGQAGDVLGNPAVEVSVIPRPNARSRAGVRVLAAQEFVPRLVVALNGYLEQNIDRSAPIGIDGAVGMTGGVSYALVPGLLHLGGEAQVGAAQYGLPGYALVAALGPNVVLHRGPFALTASTLVDLAKVRPDFEPRVTLGATF